MIETNTPFVITDRRKFNLDGVPRVDAEPSPEKDRQEVFASFQEKVDETADSLPAVDPSDGESIAPQGPTKEQMEQARIAYLTTSDRLDTAIRAANPGAERIPPITFDQLIQSFYMTAVMQLGGGSPEGQQPQIDIIGARQTIDMLALLAEKSKGNLAFDEQQLLDSALFELRIAFLDLAQALARSASANPTTPGRPSIVR
jgi:hypothetical protein